MKAHSPLSLVDADVMRRAFCPSCLGMTESVSQSNRDGHLYARCLTCACRFRTS